MEEAKILYQLTKVIQAYQGGNLSGDLFNEKVDDLFASLNPEAEDISHQVRKLVRESKFPPMISERLLGRLEELYPHLGHNRRAEDRIKENLDAVETKTIRRIMEPSVSLEADGSSVVVDDANEDGDADKAPDSGSGSNSSAPGSTADSSLLRSLLNWREGGRHKAIQPNVVIRGTYRLVSKVGKGGMGEVWKAIDLIQDAGDSRDKYVAIKFLSSEIRSHEYALKALVREFARYKKLIHPNIVRAYELNRDEDAIFIVMEFLPGLPLNKFIQKNSEGVSLEEAKPIIKGMCQALAHAHQEGVIHLDFKPGNVFYDPETGLTKVIDFGIARLAKQQEREETRFDPGALGAKTKTYASPEMLADADPFSSDDVYGLSCVIYELLTGSHPFKGTNSISAEHQGLEPLSIKGLTKGQFGAIQRGLAFRRKIRTEGADQLFRDLFPETRERGWRLSRRTLIAASVVLALILVPVFYTGFQNWRMQRIAAGVQDLNPESVVRFHDLNPGNQLDLVMNGATRASLVRFYISKATPDNNALDAIHRLDEQVQKAVFRTRDIRKLLIEHSVDMIDRAVQNDDFQLASRIADQIAAHYPDSKLLAEQSSFVNSAKKKRLIELTKRFNDCLYDSSRPLIGHLPCLKKSSQLLTKVDADNRILASPRLTARFVNEIRAALYKKNLADAGKLLANWREMIPTDVKERNDLAEQLQLQRQISELTEKLLKTTDAELGNRVAELPMIETPVRAAAVHDPEVRKRIVDWYRDKMSALANSGQFSMLDTVLYQAKDIFADDDKGLQSIIMIEQEIKASRRQKIEGLNLRYWDVLGRNEPDAETLIEVHSAIETIDPKNELLDYPRLGEIYAERTGVAIRNEQFDLAERFLNAWQKIKPEDTKTDSFVELSASRADRMAALQTRDAEIARLSKRLAAGSMDDALSQMDTVKQNFSAAEYRVIAEKIKPDFFAGLSESVRLAIREKNYPAAEKLVSMGLAHYPNDPSLQDLGRQISRAQERKVDELVSDYLGSLKATPIQGTKIFQQLTLIDSVNGEYLADHPQLFRKLGERAKTLISSENPLPLLQELFAQWDSFPAPTAESTKIYDSVKNYIALRCLFKAKLLKQSEDRVQADEYLLFGLSLNPSEKVSDSLNKELVK